MIAFGKGLFSFIKMVLLWLLSQLVALWKMTGIKNANLEWSKYGFTLMIESLYDRYYLEIYDCRHFTIRWTNRRKLTEYSRSFRLEFYWPVKWDSTYSRNWRCHRCNNIYYNPKETIPDDGICDACIKNEVIANYNGNGKVAEPA